MYYLLWYGITSTVLGILLFFPTRKFILTLNVNRHQSKVGREISSDELARLHKKVTMISACISVTFAFIYNKVVMFKYLGGLAGG